MSAQQQLSKIHLCRLAILDNFRTFYYRFINPTLLQQDSLAVDGQSSDPVSLQSLEDVLPGSIAQAVCDELLKDRNNKLTVAMLLMSVHGLLRQLP